jgi:hypothetical protein
MCDSVSPFSCRGQLILVPNRPNQDSLQQPKSETSSMFLKVFRKVDFTPAGLISFYTVVDIEKNIRRI